MSSRGRFLGDSAAIARSAAFPNDRTGVRVNLHAWELQRRRRVRTATHKEAVVVERADQVIAARAEPLPRLALDMPL